MGLPTLFPDVAVVRGGCEWIFPVISASVRFWGRGEELIVLSRLANRVECVLPVYQLALT